MMELQKISGDLADETIVKAYKDFCCSGAAYALKAVHLGLLLRELRCEKISQKPNDWPLSHSGIMARSTVKEDGFWAALDRLKIPHTTAYRCIDLAQRVALFSLGLRTCEELPYVIEVESQVIPLSRALSAPASDLPEKAQKFQQALLAFMRNKTIAEAARAAADGESDPKRITLAASGKYSKFAGKSGDRKDWPLFIGRHLQVIGRVLEHWGAMTDGQRSEAEQVLRAAILGDETRLRRGPRSVLLGAKPWPADLCKIASDTLRERLKGAK